MSNRRSRSVGDDAISQAQLDSDSSAFDVMFGTSDGDRFPRIIGADAWFDRTEARQYEISEQAKKIGTDEMLVLLTIKDDRMVDEENFGW